MPLPPGLDGYMATRQAQAQDQQQQFQMIQGLMQMQGQQQDRQQRAELFPLQKREMEAKLKKMDQQAEFSAMLGPLLNNGGASPEAFDAAAMRATAMDHPGAVGLAREADRRRQLADAAKAMQGMQSRPGVTPVTPNDDEGNPMPSIPAQPGLFSPLMNSKYVGPQAAAYQQQVNGGAFGANPQQAMGHLDTLTRIHQAGQLHDDTQAQLNNRQDKAQQFKIDFRPPSDTAPYTNVQSDGKGGFVGLNKKTMRMEAIPMAAGASMAGYGQVAPGAANLTGEDFLKSLPPGDAAIVKAVAEGRTKVTDLSTKGGHRENIIKMANQYMPGFDSVASAGNAASYNKMVQQYDAVTSFERNANRNGDVLLKLADKVDSTGVPLVERWIRAGRRASGNDDIAEFGAQLQIYRTEAARILTNPNLSGQLTDSARHEVQEFLSGDSSASQIKRVVNRLKNDFEARRTTLEDQMKDNRSRGRESKGIPTSPAATAPASRPPLSSFAK